MITSSALLVLGSLAQGSHQVSEVQWEVSFDVATRRAAAENKPVLLLQLFGRLDEELC